jgi:hypothetical protein
VPFERYRSVRRGPHASPEDAFRAAHIVDETAPVLGDVLPLSDDLSDIATARH